MTQNHDASLWNCSMLEFRNRVAAGTPTPGGGAVAAVAATFAAALMRMVCAINSKQNSDSEMTVIGAKAKICEEELARCAEEDIRVFDRYMAARRVRSVSARPDIQRCLLECAEVPLAAAEAVAKLEEYAAEIVPNTPGFLLSDLATARHLRQASRKAWLANVIGNLMDLDDGEARRAVLARLGPLQRDADTLC